VTIVVWISRWWQPWCTSLPSSGKPCCSSVPGVHQGFFAIPTADVPPVRLWAFNVGFYNLFIAGGLMAGLIIWLNGNESPGRALVIYLSLSAFLAGIALFASDPPLVALIAVPLIN
jgi:uncharacterized membrane protein